MSRNPLTIKGKRFISRSSPPDWLRCRSRSPGPQIFRNTTREISLVSERARSERCCDETRVKHSPSCPVILEKKGCKGEDENVERKLRDSAGGQNGKCKSGRDRLRLVRSRTAYTEENRSRISRSTPSPAAVTSSRVNATLSRRNTAYSSASVHIVKSVKTRVQKSLERANCRDEVKIRFVSFRNRVSV